VRRMVVVFSAKMPVKWAPLAMHPRPEKKFAASMAVGAVHRELFSTVFPANRELTGNFFANLDLSMPKILRFSRIICGLGQNRSKSEQEI